MPAGKHVGRPCRFGHTLRYPNGNCVECAKELQRRKRAADPDLSRRTTRAWYNANRDKASEYKKRTAARRRELQRKHLPAPTRPCPAVCEICSKPCKRALSLDHDHATGKFRGWLCSACNLMLGYAKDSADALRKGALYLERC